MRGKQKKGKGPAVGERNKRESRTGKIRWEKRAGDIRTERERGSKERATQSVRSAPIAIMFYPDHVALE